jgi:hypothetical protein
MFENRKIEEFGESSFAFERDRLKIQEKDWVSHYGLEANIPVP